MFLPQHPEVENDLAQLSQSDPLLSMRLVRLQAFVEHVERLSRKPDYLRLWPDRLDGDGQISLGGAKYGTTGAVTIYTWERESFVLSLEEKRLNMQSQFRWLACVPDGEPDAVIATARQRAQTHWDN